MYGLGINKESTKQITAAQAKIAAGFVTGGPVGAALATGQQLLEFRNYQKGKKRFKREIQGVASDLVGTSKEAGQLIRDMIEYGSEDIADSIHKSLQASKPLASLAELATRTDPRASAQYFIDRVKEMYATKTPREAAVKKIHSSISGSNIGVVRDAVEQAYSIIESTYKSKSAPIIQQAWDLRDDLVSSVVDLHGMKYSTRILLPARNEAGNHLLSVIREGEKNIEKGLREKLTSGYVPISKKAQIYNLASAVGSDIAAVSIRLIREDKDIMSRMNTVASQEGVTADRFANLVMGYFSQNKPVGHAIKKMEGFFPKAAKGEVSSIVKKAYTILNTAKDVSIQPAAQMIDKAMKRSGVPELGYFGQSGVSSYAFGIGRYQGASEEVF